MAKVKRDYNNLETLKARFYTKGVSFNNFKDIDKNKISELIKMSEYFKDDSFNSGEKLVSKEFERYCKVLKYLQSIKLHLDLPTFDEQVLFLIICIDPNFKMLEIYQNAKLQIKNQDFRQKELNKTLSKIRDTLGLCDIDLLNYEILFQNNYVYKNKLVPKYNKECKTLFLNMVKDVDFDHITQEHLDRINRCIEFYDINNGNRKDLDTLAFNIDKDRFGILTLEEKALLFIKIADPDLVLFKIYDEECKLDNIVYRATLEYGWYNKILLDLEKLYVERFEKKLDSWTK